MALGTPKPLSVICQQRSSRDWRCSTQTSLQLWVVPKGFLFKSESFVWPYCPISSSNLKHSLGFSAHYSIFNATQKLLKEEWHLINPFSINSESVLQVIQRAWFVFKGSIVRSWPTELQWEWPTELQLVSETNAAQQRTLLSNGVSPFS